MESDENTSVLPNEVVKRALDEIIREHLKCETYDLHVESGSAKGDNYIGVIYRAIATTATSAENDNSTENKMSLIIKVPPQNEIRRKQFFARPAFLREALVYNEILPMFLKFQETKGITSTKHAFYEISKCYAALTDDGYEAIFLKDLRDEGFQMFDRFEAITADHVKLVMKSLGKLHALSFAMKDQDPDKIAKYRMMKDIFKERENDDGLKDYFAILYQRALDTLSPTDQHLKKKVDKYFEIGGFMEVLNETVSAEKAEPYAVICHGDCWNNNVLYKHKDKQPMEARLIDWQITRYASPVCDLMYFLYSCTTKELRDKHYHEFLDIYHNELSGFLRRLGSNPDILFPKEALNRQLKSHGGFGLLMAIIILPIISTQGDEIPDLDAMSEQIEDGTIDPNANFNSEKTMKIYSKRMRDVIVDMAQYEYI